MSFNIGQFRRDQLSVNSYLINLSGSTVQDKIVTSSVSSGIKFTDQMVVLQNGTFFNSAKSYYLRISAKRNINRSQYLTVTLQNSSNPGSVQTLDTLYVPAGSAADANKVVFEMIIAPNGAYNQIVFTMNRNDAVDMTRDNGDGTFGAKVDLTIQKIGQVYNIINAMNPKPENLIKIGVQGRTGLLLDINGQPIRIGPSGIYEINNGYRVNYIGVILQDSPTTADGKDYFILDYQY